MAAALGLDCIVGRPEGGLRRARGESLEMSARSARHEFLARTAARLGLDRIALAHHADDQLEQFFLRLLRGAGGRSLAGMRWLGPSPSDPCVSLIRPLLDQPKTALAAYAQRHGIPHREDSSNRSPDPLRNRIRLDLIPHLEANYQKGLARVVGQTMDLLGEESACLEEQARCWRQSSSSPPFERIAPALQRLVLHQGLLAAGVQPSYRVIEELRATAEHRVAIGGGRCVVRDAAGHVTRVEPWMPSTQETVQREVEIALAGRTGLVDFGGALFRWTVGGRRGGRLPRGIPGKERFDADAVGDRIRLRLWRAGDRFQPIGMKFPVKLQDLFVNVKVPKAERHTRVVAEAADGRIFWVEGLRIGEQFKLDITTQRQLKWEWRRAAGVPGPFARSGSGC